MRSELSISLIASLIVTSAAMAQGPTTRQPRAALSKSELKACIVREQGLDRQSDALREAQDAHVAAGEKLSADAIELSKTLRGLDNTDELAVENYNKRNDARNREVELANRRADALNAVLDGLQSLQADFMAECASRSFNRADEQSILKDLGIKQRRQPSAPDQQPTRLKGRHDT